MKLYKCITGGGHSFLLYIIGGLYGVSHSQGGSVVYHSGSILLQGGLHFFLWYIRGGVCGVLQGVSVVYHRRVDFIGGGSFFLGGIEIFVI